MPIYEYLCTSCDHRADILHGINDHGPVFCPACGREGTMRKQFSSPTIHFKGSGWAKKDRGASSRTKAANNASSGSSGSSSGSSSGGSADGGSSGGSSDGGSSSSSDGSTSSSSGESKPASSGEGGNSSSSAAAPGD